MFRSAPSNDPRGERDAPPPDSLQHVGRGARGAGPGAHSCGPELLRLRGATGRGQAPGGCRKLQNVLKGQKEILNEVSV